MYEYVAPRSVAYFADLFWKRWKQEYLLTLKERQNWRVESKNLTEEDVTLGAENFPRCCVSAVKINRAMVW